MIFTSQTKSEKYGMNLIVFLIFFFSTPIEVSMPHYNRPKAIGVSMNRANSWRQRSHHTFVCNLIVQLKLQLELFITEHWLTVFHLCRHSVSYLVLSTWIESLYVAYFELILFKYRFINHIPRICFEITL